MKCSCCNTEMEKGYLKSSHGMHWGPDRELGSVRDDIHLAKAGWKELSEGVFVESYCCRNCGTIIVPLKKVKSE